MAKKSPKPTASPSGFPAKPNKVQAGQSPPPANRATHVPDGDMRDTSNPSAHSFGAGLVPSKGRKGGADSQFPRGSRKAGDSDNPDVEPDADDVGSRKSKASRRR